MERPSDRRTSVLFGIVFVVALLTTIAYAQSRPSPPPENEVAAPGRPGWSVDARSGCWIWNSNPRARGTFVWTGGCGDDGRAAGRGVREGYVEGRLVSRYDGEIRDGKPNGDGVVEWISDGKVTARYEGELRDGTLDGRGVLTNDGGRYEGEFRDGKPNGHGVFNDRNGYRYEGEFRNGRPNGSGVLTFPGGLRHKGKWRDGCLYAGGGWVAVIGRPKSECE